QVILKNIPELIADTIYAYNKESEVALAAAVAGGAKIHKPEEAMVAALGEFREGEVAISAKKAKSAGVENPDELLVKFLGKVDKWRAIVAETNGDQGKYEEALWDEIFSKVK
ncbi:unnamed protein product, partial [Discosporangium mesarthrocarpum]